MKDPTINNPAVGLNAIYEHRFSEKDRTSKDRIWKVLVSSFFQKFVRPSDTVLDLGCGVGEFLRHIQCSRRIGVDADAGNARTLPGQIEFHVGSICDLAFLPDASVDMVFSSNVLEHLGNKEAVAQAIGEAWRVLRPNGRIVLMGPNLRLLLGCYWDFWDHVVPITDRSLTELLEITGFHVQVCYSRFLPYTTRSSMPQMPWMVWLYLKLSPMWWVLGRQFLVVASKGVRK